MPSLQDQDLALYKILPELYNDDQMVNVGGGIGRRKGTDTDKAALGQRELVAHAESATCKVAEIQILTPHLKYDRNEV